MASRLFNVMNTRMSDLASKVDDLMLNLHNQSTQSISDITPYTATQTAYYGEKEKNFYNVPQGILTVYFDNYTGSYSVERIDDRLTVSFDTLENDTSITIIVQ